MSAPYHLAMTPAALLLGLFLAGGTAAGEPTPPPRQRQDHPDVKPPCFVVHGRLSLWNGTPSARIWIVGTKRVLGVSDSLTGPEAMPEAVRGRLTWDVDLFGDYTFCPITDEKAGVMRLGCIQSATNLRERPRK